MHIIHMYKADFGGGSRIINLNVFSFTYFMQHSLKLGKKKNWTGEVSGLYISPICLAGNI